MLPYGLFCGICLAATALPLFGGQPGAQAQPIRTLRLWSGDVPGALGTAETDIPTITIYSPPEGTANGAAVVICPGGGYGGLAEHEGRPVAEWLNTLGVTGIVLKYRLGPRYHHPVMLHDVARALRTARYHAQEWKLDPHRIGVLGFSAGGHLASTAATHFDDGDANAADPVDQVSSRPDVAILIYPVITLSGPYAHIGSRNNLLGPHPSQELIDLLSNEKQVTPKTPPTFLVHTAARKRSPARSARRYRPTAGSPSPFPPTSAMPPRPAGSSPRPRRRWDLSMYLSIMQDRMTRRRFLPCRLMPSTPS